MPPTPSSASHASVRPGERLVTQFTPEQRGWAVALLVAFLGVTFGGPALTRLGVRRRQAQATLVDRATDIRSRAHKAGKRVRGRMRRLGGGTIWR